MPVLIPDGLVNTVSKFNIRVDEGNLQASLDQISTVLGREDNDGLHALYAHLRGELQRLESGGRSVEAAPKIGSGILTAPIPSTTYSVEASRLEYPSRGGVMVKTSKGWIQLGVPMWTNKDAFLRFLQSNGFALPKEKIPDTIPTVFVNVPSYTPKTDGLLPFDFLGYMFFVTKGTTFTLVASSPEEAARMEEFLNLSYQGNRSEELNEAVRREYPEGAYGVPNLAEEISRGFPAAEPEVLRQVTTFDSSGEISLWDGAVRIRRLSEKKFEIVDGEESLGVVNLEDHPIVKPNLKRRLDTSHDPHFQKVRSQTMADGKIGLWPIGTAHGFAPSEETSGFMIWNKGRVTLVDPPSSTLEYFVSNGIPLDLVEGIIITHGHTDHHGSAIPQLIRALPKVKLYTTRTIYDMLSRQYQLAVGGPGLEQWDFQPIRLQENTTINNLQFHFDYSFHPVPALGFEIRSGNNLVLYFSGDTYADLSIMGSMTQPGKNGEPPIMTRDRALRILRHYFLISQTGHQNIPPVFLIEGGIPPIHTDPSMTHDFLEFIHRSGLNVELKVYHVANAAAAQAKVPKWPAGHEGWMNLTDHYPDWAPLTPEANKKQALDRVLFFDQLSDAEKGGLIRFGLERQLAAGEKLFSAGESGNELAVILDGELAVSREGAFLGRLQSGLVGEGSLLNEARNADVVATVPTKLLMLEGDVLGAILKRHKIADEVAQLRKTREEASPVFSQSPWGALPFEIQGQLLSIARLERASEGQELMTEGVAGRDVYVIIAGTVDIEKNGQSIATAGPADMIGEIGAIGDGIRTATVRAQTALQFLVFDHETLAALTEKYPGIGVIMHEVAGERGGIPAADEKTGSGGEGSGGSGGVVTEQDVDEEENPRTPTSADDFNEASDVISEESPYKPIGIKTELSSGGLAIPSATLRGPASFFARQAVFFRM